MSEAIDLARVTATGLVSALKRKNISARELCDAAIARIEALDGNVNAVVVRDFERARAEARVADEALARGEGETRPLLGVPMTVKEGFDLRGHPTTWGVETHKGHRAPDNAVVIQRLKLAGAVILGKTNVPPLLADWQSTNPIYGATRNPWDLRRSPGGSSGGSAAAIAMGFSALEVGTDIGGSIRVPASFCGVFGLKTSYGVVSMGGAYAGGALVKPTPLSVAGPLARSVEDIALALRVIAGPDAEAPATGLDFLPPRHASLSDYRVFVLDHHPIARADNDVLAALNAAADQLVRAGASVSRASGMLPDLRETHRLYVKMLATITSRRANAEREPISAHAWLDLLDAQLGVRRQWAEFFRHFDIVLTPAFGTVAFPHAPEPAWQDRTIDLDGSPTRFGDQLGWISIATFADLPAISFPAGLSSSGLPMGLQAIGPWLGDLQVTAFSAFLAHEMPPPPEALRPMP
jgi:amidase